MILCGIICILTAIYLYHINASFMDYSYFILPIVLVYTVISRILSLSSKYRELFVRFFKISLVAVFGASFYVIPFFWRSFVFFSFAGLAIYSALNFYLRFKQMTLIVISYCLYSLSDRLSLHVIPSLRIERLQSFRLWIHLDHTLFRIFYVFPL